MTENFERPEGAHGSHGAATGIITNDMVVIRDAERTHIRPELIGIRQHVWEVSFLVSYGVNVEKNRAWDVCFRKFGLRVPLGCGQVKARVDERNAWQTEVVRNPLRFNQSLWPDIAHVSDPRT